MSWDFTIIDRNELYALSRATPKAGDTEVFEIAGWQVEPDLVRNGGVSYQLSGESEVQYIDRNDSAVARYIGFVDSNGHSGTNLLRPPGLARSTAIKDLEYICFLPAKRHLLLNGVALDVPGDLLADYAGQVFCVLQGFVEVGGVRYEKFEHGVITGPVTGNGKIAAIWQEDRPPNVKWAPARPEDLSADARNNPSIDPRPHRVRSRIKLAPRRPGRQRPPPTW